MVGVGHLSLSHWFAVGCAIGAGEAPGFDFMEHGAPLGVPHEPVCGPGKKLVGKNAKKNRETGTKKTKDLCRKY